MTSDTPRRARPWLWVLAALSIMAILAWQAIAWTGPTDTKQDGVSPAGYDDATGLTLYQVQDRVPAPDLQGTTLDGASLALSDFAGNIVVLNVWGSWCGPCRAEAPTLARLARETADQKVRFLGIDTRDQNASAQAFVRHFKIPYPSLVDTNGQLLVQFNQLIPLSAVPSTVVVDTDGNIAAKVIGEITYTTLRGIIEDELTAGTRSPPTATPGGDS